MMERTPLSGGAIPSEQVFSNVEACRDWLEDLLSGDQAG